MSFKKILFAIGVIYFITAKGHIEIIDTEYSIRTAVAFLDNNSLLIEPPDKSIYNISNDNNSFKIYSKYGIGVWILFIPFVIAGKVLSFIFSIEESLTIGFTLSFVSTIFGVLGLWFFKKIQLQIGVSEVKSNVITIALGLTSFYWKYSTTDFTAIIQACSILAILYHLNSKSKSKFYYVSLWFSFLISIKVIYVIFIPIFIIYVYFKVRKKSKKHIAIILLKYSSLVIPTLTLILFYNYSRYGHIFETGYGNEVSMFSVKYFLRDFIPYIFSLERGILIYNPLMVFSLFGLFSISKNNKVFFMLVLSIISSFYLLMCFWEDYYGDYSWGNRFLVPILPLIFLFITNVTFSKKIQKYSFIIVFAISFTIQTSGTFTKIHEIKEVQNFIKLKSENKEPNQLITGLFLMVDKFKKNKPIYNTSHFTENDSKLIDLSSFNTFHGFNLWPVHFFNYLGYKSISYLVGLFIFIIVTFVLLMLTLPFFRTKNS